MLKNFVVTGCSFSASILEDVEATAQSYHLHASHWPHTVFAELDPVDKKLVNLAMGAGGNISSFTNLIYFLNLYKHTHTPQNTLVGFNITGLTRKDKICRPGDPQENPHRACVDVARQLNISWCPEQFNRNDDSELLIIQSTTAIITAISYLELHKYKYFFMLMNDSIYHQSPLWFQEFLDQRKNKNWITFEPQLSMWEFAKSQNLCATNAHPNRQAHKIIGHHIVNHLKYLAIND